MKLQKVEIPITIKGYRIELTEDELICLKFIFNECVNLPIGAIGAIQTRDKLLHLIRHIEQEDE